LITKLAVTVTALFGMEKIHGLAVAPPEHDAPEVVQLENVQPEAGYALTEIDVPRVS
jgi:hypothetical protein